MEALIARSVQILIALGGAYILTLWFAIVVWTFQDIQARSRSVVAQIFSTLVVMIFSIPGLLVYMILRPRYTLDDAFQRSLEEEYLMQDLEELPLCPGCQQYVEDDWVFCPNCRTELRDNCIACDRLIDLRWEICPFCGTEQYEDDEDALPAPVIQPVMGPSPQYLGRPQMTRTEVLQLQSDEQRTRPIIPATVRVDLRSGDVLTEQVPELPVVSPMRPNGGQAEPRRVSLDGNGGTDVSEQYTEDESTEESARPAAEAEVEPDEIKITDDEAVTSSLTPDTEDLATDGWDAPEQAANDDAEEGQELTPKSRRRKRKARRSRKQNSSPAGDGESVDD